MENSVCKSCGGCVYRGLGLQQYRENELNEFRKTVQAINGGTPQFDEPVFIDDGKRRRADMEFSFAAKKLSLGFNEAGTHNLTDLTCCPMLDDTLNKVLPFLRAFLEEFCTVPITVKNKKKKFETSYIRNGSVRLLHADNGIDILLNLPMEPSLEHRLAVADFVNTTAEICRLSWCVNGGEPETVVEKFPPELYIAGAAVEVPPGVFLQASKDAENAMIQKVSDYMGETGGKIADLFCGLGTFTYPLAKVKGNTIVSADSSAASLCGLKRALNRNQIHNVEVANRNLFKYPFDADDLKGVKAVVIDPPRAGAHAQCRELAQLPAQNRPQKIIYVSCNPKTFVYDAEQLINAGYVFERVTLIDQFVYSKHQELIALFNDNSQD